MHIPKNTRRINYLHLDLFHPFFHGSAAKMRAFLQSAAEPSIFAPGPIRQMEMTRDLHGGDPWVYPSDQVCPGV